MKELELHFKNNNLYHAYCIVGENLTTEVEGLFKDGKNFDYFNLKVNTFGIDDSRQVKTAHAMKSTYSAESGGKKIFIIEINSITSEAQNALLKVFEEPQINAHFFLIVPSVEILLPTLRSRMMILRNSNTNALSLRHDMKAGAEDFIKMQLKDRIKFVDDLAADISDEKKTKQDALSFVSGLEASLAFSFKKNKKNSELSAIEAIIRARDYMQDRSPSIKQLLEYVALSV